MFLMFSVKKRVLLRILRVFWKMDISLFYKVFAIFLKNRDFEKFLVVTTFPHSAYIVILLAICFWPLVL